jgi:hypothetical protein
LFDEARHEAKLVTRRITVHRDDDPGIVAEKFAEVLNALGLKVTNLDPDGEDSQEYLIEAMVEE